MKALILVDLQNDFMPGGALAVPNGDQVIPVANKVQGVFDRVIATKDWHPADHGSFAANHDGREPGSRIELAGIEQILWPVHCVQETQGSAFAPGLDTSRIEKIFFKGVDPDVDSYSAFFDNAHKRSTGLGMYLRDTGVEAIWILGLAIDYCVKFSVLDALKLDFQTTVIEDGCRAVELQAGDGSAALDEIRQAGAGVVHSSELLAVPV